VYENVNGGDIRYGVRFGSDTKYVVSDNLEKAYLSCKFGSLKVYFDNVRLSPAGATIHINAEFSGVELFIPKTWQIRRNASNFLGGVEEKGRNTPDPNSPVLTITGNVSFSGVVIYYV